MCNEFLQIERRVEMMRNEDKCLYAEAPPQPEITKRRGSYLWRVLQTKLFTRSQISRNTRGPGMFEEGREENQGTEVVTEEKGLRLSTIIEES